MIYIIYLMVILNMIMPGTSNAATILDSKADYLPHQLLPFEFIFQGFHFLLFIELLLAKRFTGL